MDSTETVPGCYMKEDLDDLKHKARKIIKQASNSGRNEARLNINDEQSVIVTELQKYLTKKGCASEPRFIQGRRILVINKHKPVLQAC